MIKTICVPKNREALDRLDYDKTEDGDLFEIYLDTNVYSELCDMGFFQAINNIGNTNIDDFEDDSIIEEIDLKNVLNSGFFCKQGYNVEIFKVVKKIEELFVEALKCRTGIFFYF